MRNHRGNLKGTIMWKPEYAYDREHDDFSMTPLEARIKGFEDLGNLVIVDAMKCYAKAYHKGDEAGIKREAKFFNSGFFAAICSYEPEYIMNLACKRF